MPTAERRQFPRYHMALDIMFGPACLGEPATRTAPNDKTIARPPKNQLEQSVTVDLSVGGLCVYSDVLYPIGAQIFCAVTLPGHAEPVEALGTTVWFSKVDQETHGYKLGIEFTTIAPKSTAALQALFEHPPAGQAVRAKKLLLVDDDLELQRAFKLRFESAGFQVVTAGDGLEALRKGREEHPHLIILDLMLPQLNGYEVCRLLKFDQRFARIPIILFTARSRTQDMELGTTVGADAYMTKPCSGTSLLAKVEELLGARQG